MTEDAVPPARQCTMCSREAVDPTRHGALCREHLESLENDENPEEEAGSPRSNPGGDADTSRSTNAESEVLGQSANDQAVAALGDALDWYHDQLDRELPDEADHNTPREYYEQGRGWEPDTVDEKRLGYAPADHKDALLAHLFDRGHPREAILATGLFGEREDGGLYATWRGRYVLPYFDAEGTPVYAISRATEPVHPADWKGNKYDKLQVTREDVTVEEPIYGLDTVRDGEPVLITEGIADAITAHQAGYPCVSPVTVQFKHSDREDLRDALADHGVGRVYLIQDAERPTSSVDDRDRLTLQQFGDGVKGAVKTAAYLSDHGLEARVADLPRPGLDKVDLDDYLQVWTDDLAPLLASAKPVDQHAAYEGENAKDLAVDAAKTSTTRYDGDGSALFDLDIQDVTGLSSEYRGPNPLGHHGDSENYFVLLDDHGVAYDHKHKVAYTPLSYLLVDAGERRPGSPNGTLDDGEIFTAWTHAKDEGLLEDADPVPRRGLQHVAREATDWDGDLVEHETRDGDTFDGLPRDVYNAALAHIREEYDLDPGRSPVHGYDAEPVAPFALKKLDALSGHERERFARKRGLSIPSTSDARDDLREAVCRELQAGNTTVLDAPTALGKSYTAATEPWRRRSSTTGDAPVIHLHPTRDARDEAAEASAEAGVDYAVLYGRKEKCPVARGDHDPVEDPDDEDAPDQIITIDGEPASVWFDRQCDHKGLPFSTAHALAHERNDQDLDDLPCTETGDCPAVTQWDGLPRTDDGEPAKDVIHATHQFGYVPSLRAHTNVILDEQPDFTIDLNQERIRRMVNAYLREIDAPVSTWEALVQLARFDHNGADSDAGREQDALDDALGTEPPTEWYVDDADAHALAPDLTRAIWDALRWEEPNTNGRRSRKVLHEPPRFDAEHGDGYAGTWLSVVIDETNTVRTVRSTPDFSQARAVIGLDAHPCMPRWELNAAPGMVRDAVLEPAERRLWRRYERGLTVVQVGDATRPRSGDKAQEWMNDDRVRTVLKRLRGHYGDDLKTAITTSQVERPVRERLREFDDAVDEENTMHYGEEKSRNDFADEEAGLLYGCMDPGDEMILDALAELNLKATPATVETEDGEEKREKGRTFDGPDADTAEAVLASVRENHVAQAAGRYARNPDDLESRAVVFAMTDALPPGFADLKVPGVEWLATETQREIINTLAERPSATVREIADAVECTKEHVRETLGKLEDENLVDRHAKAGDHGADVYHGDDLDGATVDLGLGSVETTNDALKDSSRWSLAVCRLHRTDSGEQPGESPTSDAVEATTTGDPPPNTGD